MLSQFDMQSKEKNNKCFMLGEEMNIEQSLSNFERSTHSEYQQSKTKYSLVDEYSSRKIVQNEYHVDSNAKSYLNHLSLSLPNTHNCLETRDL